MSEALLDRKYEYWQNQLLDLGKRNRMINYRETKRATLKLIEPKFEELFKRVAIDEEELTFQSPIDKNSDIRTYSVLSLLESLSCPIPVNIGDIKAEGSILERQKTLKQLRSKSRLALDEQGTNILYMVSGFVEWREKNNASSTWIKSPLILVPVSLVLESINSPYILKKYEDDIVVNPTLSYLFERDYGIVLPSFDPDEESIIEYMDKMEKLVDRKGWRIIRENSIGLVSFLKINMYKDLCNNEEEVKNNPIIRAFAGENSEISNIPPELYNFNHDNTPAMDIYQVVNADSSQQDAILLSRKGISFVMQGPPGTGKSQTITNIIAQGLADGKRILFVSEKAAALEVVHKRLSEVHLDDFCLALHNYKANKKDVLDELGKSLSLNPIKVKAEETAKLTELDTLKEFLGKYVSDIHKEIMPLEMSLYEVYGAILALEDTIELPLEIENVENMTKDQVNRLGLLVVDFDKAKSNLGDQWYKNPWNGTIIANVTYELSNRIQESLTSILFNMKPFISDMNNLIDAGNQILCLSNMEIYQEFIQKCIECKSVPVQWIGDCNLVSEVERTANDLKKKKSDVLDNRHYLENIFSDGFFMINAEQKATIVSNLKKSVDEILKLEQCQWNQYILEVQDRTTKINDAYVEFDRALREMKEFCDSLGINHASTVSELYERYRLYEILVQKHLVALEWFDVNTEDIISNIDNYEKLCANLLRRENCVAEHSDIKIVNSIYNIECTTDDIRRHTQLLDFKFNEFIEYINRENEQYIQIKEIYDEINDSVSEKVTSIIALPANTEDIKRCIQILKLLIRDVKPGDSWYEKSQDVIFDEQYNLCVEQKSKYDQIKSEIESNWDKDIYKIEHKELLNRFRSEYQSFFKIFKKSYREDMKTLKGFYHSTSTPLKGIDMIISMLEKLAQLDEIESWFSEKRDILKSILGEKFCGINTDFSQIKEDRDAYKECYAIEGVASKVMLYIDKYNGDDKKYFVIAIDLLSKLYELIINEQVSAVFQEQSISNALELIKSDIDTLYEIWNMYESNKALLHHAEDITVAQFLELIDTIIEYHKQKEEKGELEKILRTTLKDTINDEISNLSDIRQGIAVVETLKEMFISVPYKVKELLVSSTKVASLQYSEDSVRNIVDDLTLQLQNKDIEHKNCEEFQKQIEGVLYDCDELQSEYESVVSFCKDKNCNIDLMDCLDKLNMEQKYKRMLSEQSAKYCNDFGSLYEGENTDWDIVLTQIKNCIQLNDLAEQLKWSKQQCEKIFVCNQGEITLETVLKNTEKLVNLKNECEWICSLFGNDVNFMDMDFDKLYSRWTNCVNQIATLDSWIDFRDCKKRCCDAGLEKFVLAAEDAYYKTGTLVDSFMKGFYLKWIEINCASTDAVAQFRARIQESKIERYCELDTRQLPIAQMRIREKLISDMPNRNNFNRATDEMGVLLHELNKKRKIMPLRKLFRTIPNLLLKLKPCLMMSPLSVSYFLEAETYKFDMVIFDEASQIFPQDAIGAICRGKQVIVAGDSKQLPPTSFFASSTNNSENEYDTDEDEDEVIYDSILEEATNSLPNRSLLWHYRSRNEDLIAFSNQEIYKNKLTTFPSSNTVAADSGVEYVYVEDGTYSGRCNVKEAKKCVELIKQHIIKHPERSLGIIAFSEKQQATIEEAVQKFRESNPMYEKFFSEEKEEPFFIKNLENVQGDERDTIIFSICYAKDPNGRMYMRFGPLGHQGGERRLNVAITRAKHNVKLVGSIMPYDIDLSKTKSEGIRMLKDYIEFAIKGSSVLRPYKNPNALYDTDEFCNGVLNFIKSKGYSAKQYVGSSDYKIDIAVEHPQYPGCYVAGIECDGNTYYMARTTRDREHLRKSVLEQMGWNMFRVWSTEWINNKEGEQKRLLDFIDSAIKNYKKSDEKEKMKVPEKREESVQVEVLQKTQENKSTLDFPYYQIGDWRRAEFDYNKGNLQNLSARIRAVVEVEQPIHLDILYRRLASAFGNEKATKPIRYTIDQALDTVMKDEIVIEDKFVRFKNFTNIRARIPMGTQDRNIEYISKPEIADAMMVVIKNSYGIDKDALCAEVTSIFGYDRMGPKISKAMNETIDYMVEKGMVKIVDGKMHIN